MKEGKGSWVFKGYKEDNKVINKENIEFLGVWEYVEPKPEPKSEPTSEIQSKKTDVLPNTGEKQSNVEIFGMLLGAAGVIMMKRKRNAK